MLLFFWRILATISGLKLELQCTEAYHIEAAHVSTNLRTVRKLGKLYNIEDIAYLNVEMNLKFRISSKTPTSVRRI